MAYVIAEPCIGTKDTACVDACPVDCIHPKKDEDGHADADQLFIDPVECIDCGACVPACPVSAIFAQDDLPEKWATSPRRTPPTSAARSCRLPWQPQFAHHAHSVAAECAFVFVGKCAHISAQKMQVQMVAFRRLRAGPSGGVPNFSQGRGKSSVPMPDFSFVFPVHPVQAHPGPGAMHNGKTTLLDLDKIDVVARLQSKLFANMGGESNAAIERDHCGRHVNPLRPIVPPMASVRIKMTVADGDASMRR